MTEVHGRLRLDCWWTAPRDYVHYDDSYDCHSPDFSDCEIIFEHLRADINILLHIPYQEVSFLPLSSLHPDDASFCCKQIGEKLSHPYLGELVVSYLSMVCPTREWLESQLNLPLVNHEGDNFTQKAGYDFVSSRCVYVIQPQIFVEGTALAFRDLAWRRSQRKQQNQKLEQACNVYGQLQQEEQKKLPSDYLLDTDSTVASANLWAYLAGEESEMFSVGSFGLYSFPQHAQNVLAFCSPVSWPLSASHSLNLQLPLRLRTALRRNSWQVVGWERRNRVFVPKSWAYNYWRHDFKGFDDEVEFRRWKQQKMEQAACHSSESFDSFDSSETFRTADSIKIQIEIAPQVFDHWQPQNGKRKPKQRRKFQRGERRGKDETQWQFLRREILKHKSQRNDKFAGKFRNKRFFSGHHLASWALENL